LDSGIAFEFEMPAMHTLRKSITQIPVLFLCSIAFYSFAGPEPVPEKAPSKKTTARRSSSEKSKWPPSPYKIVIDKSDYELQVYDQDGWLMTFPVVFGNKDFKDKQMEGDRKTPNGHFRIAHKKYHKEWGCFLLLDYPNQESYRRFKERRSKGLLPASAKIGGGIGIHGTRPNEEFVVDKYINWTNGCISVKYSDIFELYNLIPLGTEVEVRE
jgi:murein L,D-transpeptidase YafK